MARLSKGSRRIFPRTRTVFISSRLTDDLAKPSKCLSTDSRLSSWFGISKGNPEYHERKSFAKGENVSGLKLELTFADGEVLAGSALLGYDPKRQGNFLIPADQKSNNTRVFAVSSAVKSVRQVYDHLLEEKS